MKATGVIRRIDDLGRIVIPKEIRKSLRIREGDNIEIYLADENIVLKKYSAIKKISDFAQQLSDVIYSYEKKNIIITDNDLIIASSGNNKNKYKNKYISDFLVNIISRRSKIFEKYIKPLDVTSSICINTKYVLSTIISNGDSIGLVIIYDENNIDNIDYQICNIVSDFIGSYLS